MRDTSGVTKRFFLIDCNNFFVSCEQLFNPRLLKKPVVVLSNNDGFVVSRSQEAKDLGIKMGEAVFKIDSLVKRHEVQVLSSNFSLYADMSARVMQTLALLAADIEVYSIDEAFLFVPYTKDYVTYGRHIRAVVIQHTGIPISVGIAPTKTLAKVANKLAKKRPKYQGVCDITEYAQPDIDTLLASLPVGDVWRVGRKYGKMLLSNRIKTIKDLKYASDAWIRKKMTIVGLKTVKELRGIPCLELVDQVPAKQSITVSRSFGNLVTDKKHLQQAVASYMIRAAQKLRKEKELASQVTVFIATSRYHDHEQYFKAASYTCPVATDYTPELLDAASACLEAIFRQGYRYKKAGIMLNNLVSVEQRQLDLLSPIPDIGKQKELMTTCDTITSRFGSHALSYVSAGKKQTWKAKRLKKSPHYTTNWHELLIALLVWGIFICYGNIDFKSKSLEYLK